MDRLAPAQHAAPPAARPPPRPGAENLGGEVSLRSQALTSPHSITSSASASSLSGTSRPIAFAVLRLITNSNLVGWVTGRSAGFVPLRMRPAYTPAWRPASKTEL